MQVFADSLLYSIIEKCKTCNDATYSAHYDFDKGIYQIVEWGLGNSKTGDLTTKILEEKYGVKTARGGCVIDHTIDCYNIEMKRLLDKKYGDKIFLSAYREAAQKVYQEDLARYIYQEKYRKRPRP